jgi:4-hydroxybenzoate polyprenyltransferase
VGEYLAAMFPPLVQIPTGALLFFAIHAGLQGMAGLAPIRLGPRALAGAATIVLFALLLRVQDELKDLATDVALARAGDPRFAARPVVLGRVGAADLVRLRRLVVATLLALNLPLGFPLPLLPFLLALSVTWLSGRWFYWPPMARDLVLAFATHNPMALLYAAYAAAVLARELGPAQVRADASILLLAVWLPVAAWEVARKIRAPDEETVYETWSSRLGWRNAAALPPLLCTASAAGFFYAARAAQLGPAYPTVLGAALLLVLAAFLRFRLMPSARTSRLRVPVEVFAVVAAGGLVVALAISRGFAWISAAG